MHVHVPLCCCVPQIPGQYLAAAACGGHPLDREEQGQTVGMQHRHLCSFRCHQEDHLTGGSSCAASVSGDNTVHTLGLWDQESSRGME